MPTHRPAIALSITALAASASAQCPLNFGAMTSYPVASGAGGIVSADFNNDGKPDVALYGDPFLSVFLNTGGGLFQQAASLPVDTWPGCITAGDFDGDGNMDIAVACGFNTVIDIYLGNGNGTFHPKFTVPAGPSGAGAVWVAVGDFNNDGHADLVVGNFQSEISILKGVGDGSFVLTASYPTPGNIYHVSVGDLNNDGVPDIVAANTSGANTVTVFMGNGDATFTQGQVVAVGAVPFATLLADLNGDGKLDLAVSNVSGANVSVAIGKGDGTFLPVVNYAVGNNPGQLAAADLNGDGNKDLVVVCSASDQVWILAGVGGGAFVPGLTLPTGVAPREAAVRDLNGDGTPDIAIAVGTGSVLTTYFNFNGSSSTPSITVQPAATTIAGVGSTVHLSVAVDGHGDQVSYRWRRNGVNLWNGGAFSGATTAQLTMTAVHAAEGGTFDVVVTTPGCGGAVTSATSTPAVVAITSCIADLNGDGKTDGADLGLLLASWGNCP